MKRICQICLIVLTAVTSAQAQSNVTFTPLVAFAGTNSVALGAVPEAVLIQGADGYLYGTTLQGGTNGAALGGYGTVFKMSTNGTLTTLVSFNNTNGAFPQAGLVQARDGNFYGTTSDGGTNNIGTIFRVSPTGAFSSLYSFTVNYGYNPNGLIQAADGFLYGTAYYGGTNGGGFNGSVFRISTNGAITSVASFNNTNGANPQCGLVQGPDGTFYGTTASGGTNGGWGTVFKVTTNGLITSLLSFNGTNGANPLSTLAFGSDGMLYGTTSSGGINFNNSPYTGNGTIFRISTNGNFETLHFFAGYPGDGAEPDFVGLAQGSDGNFYGTTFYGGTNGAGTVFRVSPGGSLTNLYSFGLLPNGDQPWCGLVQASDGSFYGTTGAGGPNNFGTIFKLAVPLNPPANQISGIKVVGPDVLVTISSVAAESYQLQYRPSLTVGAWANVRGASAIGFGGPLTLTNLGGAGMPTGFYRIAITP